MSKVPDIRLTRALFVKDLHEKREARIAAAQQSADNLPEPERAGRLEDAFRDAFKSQPYQAPPPPQHGQPPQESPWDRIIRTLGDDDTPRPPQADPEPVPAPVPVAPPMETRARQEALTAEALFQQMEQRLTATPEAVTLPPDVVLRRAFRELPGAQREALAKVIEAQDYGMPGYFDGRAFSDDYRAVLVGTALSRRFQDAQRLDPSLTPDGLLSQMLNTAT